MKFINHLIDRVHLISSSVLHLFNVTLVNSNALVLA